MVVRRLTLCAVMVFCLAVAGPVWAGTLTFNGTSSTGQGALNFTPGMGDSLTIGAGAGGLGALVTDLISSFPICGGDCTITGGYLTLKSGGETSGSATGLTFGYTFGAGGTLSVIGGIAGLGIANNSTLLTVSFLPNATFSGAITTGVFQGALNLATLSLNATILNALGGIKFTGGSHDDITISLDDVCQMGGKCNGPILASTTAFQFIPEPATLSVMGVGLFAFGAGLRRKMANTANTRGA